MEGVRLRNGSETTTPSIFERRTNMAKIKADALDAEALAKLGLVRVTTMSMKLKAKSAA